MHLFAINVFHLLLQFVCICEHQQVVKDQEREASRGREFTNCEMEGDAEARAVLEIIRRNGGPGCFSKLNPTGVHNHMEGQLTL